MKRIFTIIILLFIFKTPSFSQSVVLMQNDFAGYVGTIGTIAPGWNYSYNDSGVSKSFYISAGNFGTSAPSYKFGRDSTTIISPRLIGSPDSISFWMKGNGSTTSLFSLQNSFYIYESTDSINWTLNMVIDSLPVTLNGSTDSMSVKFSLNSTTAFLKFFYQKFVGNIAFDDLMITGLIDGVSSLPVNDKAPVIYPNPSKGLVSIDLKTLNNKNVTISFYNVLGKEVKKSSIKSIGSFYQLDISEFQDGVSFVKVKSESGENTQRLILRK